MTAGLNDRVHGRSSIESCTLGGPQIGPHKRVSLAEVDPKVHLYWRRMRVPLMRWLLSVLRKLGISRSINSKYEDSAGDV